MKLTDKNIREREFHNKLQSKTKGRFENIFYKAISNAWEDFYNYLDLNAKNSELLDYGCGVGPVIEKVVKLSPKKVTGIDISEISISKAKEKLVNSGSKVELLVDNCEKTMFSNSKFDIVYGLGILHHLQFSMCINEISRILESAKKRNLFAGIHNGTAEYAKKMISKGFNLVTVGSDQRFMSAGAKAAIEYIKGIKKGKESKGY